MVQRIYKWGIIGCGKIAGKFAEAIAAVPNAKLEAVASRSLDKAKNFAATHNAAEAYGSYQKLLHEANIDAVYIATPHVFHKENTFMALEAGVPTLCEKAFAMNAKEVGSMIEKAKEKQVFLMEAIWTRFIPATQLLLQLIKDDVIGEIKTIKADFGFNAPFDVTKRIYNLDLGGGSLLDVGIYPIFLSKLLLGNPTSVQAAAVMTSSSVDASCAMIFKYQNPEQLAILDSSVSITTPTEAWIYGTKGTIHMHSRFHHSKKLTLYSLDHEFIRDYEVGYIGNGYAYEIEEVQRCLEQDKLQSDALPHSFSLELIKIMDEVRNQCGIVYPNHD